MAMRATLCKRGVREFFKHNYAISDGRSFAESTCHPAEGFILYTTVN